MAEEEFLGVFITHSSLDFPHDDATRRSSHTATTEREKIQAISLARKTLMQDAKKWDRKARNARSQVSWPLDYVGVATKSGKRRRLVRGPMPFSFHLSKPRSPPSRKPRGPCLQSQLDVLLTAFDESQNPRNRMTHRVLF